MQHICFVSNRTKLIQISYVHIHIDWCMGTGHCEHSINQFRIQLSQMRNTFSSIIEQIDFLRFLRQLQPSLPPKVTKKNASQSRLEWNECIRIIDLNFIIYRFGKKRARCMVYLLYFCESDNWKIIFSFYAQWMPAVRKVSRSCIFSKGFCVNWIAVRILAIRFVVPIERMDSPSVNRNDAR